MLSTNAFIKGSLETHLFFARIMKDHLFFLQVGFTPRDTEYIQHANMLRIEFDKLLLSVVNLSNCVVNPSIIQSGEIVTKYTVKAEDVSSFYTGVMIPSDISKKSMKLTGSSREVCDPRLEHDVHMINEMAICLIKDVIEFKTNILDNVLSCKMFTMNYPLLIEHILREAKLYLCTIKRIQNRDCIDIEKEMYMQEAFWNRAMAEHSKFIRGLLDPTENKLINLANDFANEFDDLTQDVLESIDKSSPIQEVTEDSLEATKRIRDFNAQATSGLIDCKIESVILPLLGDHVLRESNHFIRLLKKFSELE